MQVNSPCGQEKKQWFHPFFSLVMVSVVVGGGMFVVVTFLLTIFNVLWWLVNYEVAY